MTRKIYNGLDMLSQKIVNVLNPTSAQDASTKNYCDNNQQPALCVVRRTASQTSSATVNALLAIDFPTASMTEDFDTLGWHNPASNSTRVTPTIAGTYGVVGSVFWNTATDAKNRKTIIQKNGTTTIPGSQALGLMDVSQLMSQQAPVSFIAMNGTTDYLELMFAAGVASALTFGSSTDGPMLCVWLIR